MFCEFVCFHVFWAWTAAWDLNVSTSEITVLEPDLLPRGRSSHFLMMRKSQIKQGLPPVQPQTHSEYLGQGNKQTQSLTHSWSEESRWEWQKFCLSDIISKNHLMVCQSFQAYSGFMEPVCVIISQESVTLQQRLHAWPGVFMNTEITMYFILLCYCVVYNCVLGFETMGDLRDSTGNSRWKTQETCFRLFLPHVL